MESNTSPIRWKILHARHTFDTEKAYLIKFIIMPVLPISTSTFSHITVSKATPNIRRRNKRCRLHMPSRGRKVFAEILTAIAQGGLLLKYIARPTAAMKLVSPNVSETSLAYACFRTQDSTMHVTSPFAAWFGELDDVVPYTAGSPAHQSIDPM